jgi:glycosyltransferase involved in cell wall biosynthesis
VITTYRRPDEAKRAINSVLKQTYEPLEVIVVEDGEDSGIAAWLNALPGNPVRYHRLPRNQGLAAARNAGWRLAQSDYVAYLDDDDVWKPERIARQMQCLMSLSAGRRERVGVVTCGTEMHYTRSGRIAVRMPRNEGNLREAIIREGASTPSSSFLFVRSALQQVGGFDETLPSSIDHDIWMSLAAAGYDTTSVHEPLVIHYDRVGRQTAMGASVRRVAGVKAYLGKWMPTFEVWLGPDVARRYARRYFREVIGHLAATKIVSGQFREALYALKEMVAAKDSLLSVLGGVAGASVRMYAQSRMPGVVVDSAKRLRRALLRG